MKLHYLTIIFSLLIPSFVNAQKGKTVSLFTPQKKDWYVFVQGAGKDNDSLRIFQFESDILHVSGEKFGYISTEKSYSNFHLTLEFKWGEKNFLLVKMQSVMQEYCIMP